MSHDFKQEPWCWSSKVKTQQLYLGCCAASSSWQESRADNVVTSPTPALHTVQDIWIQNKHFST